MSGRLLNRLVTRGRAAVQGLRRRPLAVTCPAAAPLVAGTSADLLRARSALVAENVLLRRPLAVLRRGVKRPRCTTADRVLPVRLTSRVRAWRQAPPIVQPMTVLRWHRQPFRGYWRRNARAVVPAQRPPLASDTVAPIRETAAANRLCGAGRIPRELPELDLPVVRSTIQRYLRDAHQPGGGGQSRATLLRDHMGEIRACDFLPGADVFFRPVCALFVVVPASRRVVHVGATRHPPDARVARQLLEATPSGQRPTNSLRDSDRKYGPTFARVAAATDITILRTIGRAPRQNAACERFLGSVRRECLDHVVVPGEGHLRRILREYVPCFNGDRPHQGPARRVPDRLLTDPLRVGAGCSVKAPPIPGGLHHVYARAAYCRTDFSASTSQDRHESRQEW